VTLRQKIEQEIRERGPIPFSRYMEICLYDAELGYYSRNVEQFGKAGDFYTSSDVHAVFGQPFRKRLPDAVRRAGDDGDFVFVTFGHCFSLRKMFLSAQTIICHRRAARKRETGDWP